jgi:hypothetical protein
LGHRIILEVFVANEEMEEVSSASDIIAEVSFAAGIFVTV